MPIKKILKSNPILKNTKKSISPKISLSLPTEKKRAINDLQKYTILVYGREKIGKTQLFSTFPDALFFTTEPATKGLEIFEFNSENGGCTNWNIIREGTRLLEETDRFSNIIIDTADRAYDMCLDYICINRGIEYPGADEEGKQDFGKSWRAVQDEFMSVIDRLLRTGRGICFTSHSKEETIKNPGRNPITKVYPSMSMQARRVIQALVDIFFYADYFRTKEGKVIRVLVTEGDDTLWAGYRKCPGRFPRFLPLNGYTTFQKGFMGNHPGIDPNELVSTLETSTASEKLLNKEKTALLRERISNKEKS